MNQTRRAALRENKREQLNRRAAALFAAGWLTGVIPVALMGLWDAIITAAI